MNIGYMKPSYLVLLGLAAAMLLFYAAYISSSPFEVHTPMVKAKIKHVPPPNDTLIIDSLTSQNHTELTNETLLFKNLNKSSTSISTSLSTPSIVTSPHIVVNKSNNVVETVPQAVLASSIYVPGPAYINPKICPDNGSTLQLLIVIPSAPSHHEARMAVRQTWGHFNNRRDVSIAFMLGITKNSSLQNQINSEEYLYGDIIQGKFMDTYDNLTLKTIAILEWVDNYCSNVAFVLKTDDDMFINVPKLLTFISKHNKNNRVIYGRLAKKWKPIRNKKSKYYISRQQYKPAVFPDFTTGPAYLISSCVIHDLYLAALNHTYFKLEDVFITGIVAHYINVKRIHVNEFLNKRVSLNTCNIQKGISIHMVRYHEQFDVWKRLFEDSAKCT